MKKAITVFLVGLLAAGALGAPAAEAAKKKKRKAEGSYDMPTLVIAGSCAQTGAIGCVSFVATSAEKYFTAEITDQHGQPAYVSIGQDTNGDNADDQSVGSFCGKTEEPIAFDPKYELHMWVGLSPDPGFAGCVPGIATSGTVSVVFSNLP